MSNLFKKSFIGCLIAGSLIVSHTAGAINNSVLSLNYDGFFDRIEKLDEPEFANVKLAFYLKNIETNEVCPIESVSLKTKLKSRDVYFYESGEILIPYDKQLDLDKAKVVIVKKTAEDCALDMRLEAVATYGDSIQTDTMLKLLDTFDLALKEQAGMMSFLMPSVTGITFIADNELAFLNYNSKIGKCVDNRCTITKNELEGLAEPLVLSTNPKRVIPHIGQ